MNRLSRIFDEAAPARIQFSFVQHFGFGKWYFFNCVSMHFYANNSSLVHVTNNNGTDMRTLRRVEKTVVATHTEPE
jgi:hypothetical protein